MPAALTTNTSPATLPGLRQMSAHALGLMSSGALCQDLARERCLTGRLQNGDAPVGVHRYRIPARVVHPFQVSKSMAKTKEQASATIDPAAACAPEGTGI